MPIPDRGLTTAPRITYYNPMLDEHCLDDKMTDKMREAVESGKYDDGTPAQGGRLEVPDAWHPYNLVSSLCTDGLHRPAFDVDLDWEAVCKSLGRIAEIFNVDVDRLLVVPSTNNFHVYIPSLVMQHAEYFEALEWLAKWDIIEEGYLTASRNRGQTLLRPTHIPSRRKVGVAP